LREERDGLSNSSSSQARHELASNNDKMMGMIVKVALRRSVSVNLAELWRVLEIKHGRLGITAPTKFEVEKSFMKVGGSRPGV
jgi:hypothetical protein